MCATRSLRARRMVHATEPTRTSWSKETKPWRMPPRGRPRAAWTSHCPGHTRSGLRQARRPSQTRLAVRFEWSRCASRARCPWRVSSDLARRFCTCKATRSRSCRELVAYGDHDRIRQHIDVRHIRSDAGNAVLEFVVLAAFLMVPLIYIIIAVAQVQGSAYGATEATREAGRAFVGAATSADASRQACTAATVALRNEVEGRSTVPANCTCRVFPTRHARLDWCRARPSGSR